MGEENKGAGMVLYMGSQPIGHIGEIPEITVEQAGPGVTMDQLTAALNCATDAWKAVATSIHRFARAVEKIAVWTEAARWAKVYHTDLIRRYKATKKGRTRKKYRDRIVAWYLKEVRAE